MKLRVHTPRDAQSPALTVHARRRMRERGIRVEEIEIVRRFGRSIHAAGVFQVSLDGTSRPQGVSWAVWASASLVVLIEAPDGRVVTAYRRLRKAARHARP